MKTKTKKPISILKAIKGKPSVALQMMIDGLRHQRRRPNFIIAMGTYGSNHGDKLCYGCAATCTIQQVAHKDFVNGEINSEITRAEYLDMERGELVLFERAIDDARSGWLKPLFIFCKKETDYYKWEKEQQDKDFIPYLSDDFHPRLLLQWQRIINQMKKAKL